MHGHAGMHMVITSCDHWSCPPKNRIAMCSIVVINKGTCGGGHPILVCKERLKSCSARGRSRFYGRRDHMPIANIDLHAETNMGVTSPRMGATCVLLAGSGIGSADNSNWECFWQVTAGSRLCLMQRSGARFRPWIAQYNVRSWIDLIGVTRIKLPNHSMYLVAQSRFQWVVRVG